MQRYLSLFLIACTLGLMGCGQMGSTMPASPSPESPDTPVDSGTPTRNGPALDGTLTGTVRDAAGNPIEGVLVTPVSLDDPPAAVPEIAVISDAAGTYTWTLPPGRYELRFSGAGGALHRAEVLVTTGLPTTVDIAFP